MRLFPPQMRATDVTLRLRFPRFILHARDTFGAEVSARSFPLLFSLVTTVAADKECFCGTLHDPTYMGDVCKTDIDCTNAHE